MLKMYCKVLLAALLSEGRVDHSALNDNLVLPGVKAGKGPVLPKPYL